LTGQQPAAPRNVKLLGYKPLEEGDDTVELSFKSTHQIIDLKES